jgi:hypothetical protein
MGAAVACLESASWLQPTGSGDRGPGLDPHQPGQHKTNTTRAAGEDQHENNTDKTALHGTRRHDC